MVLNQPAMPKAQWEGQRFNKMRTAYKAPISDSKDVAPIVELSCPCNGGRELSDAHRRRVPIDRTKAS